MKIRKIEKKTVSVDEIEVGECFAYDNEIFMRLSAKDQYLKGGLVGDIPVLNLSRGSLDYFLSNGDEVEPVNAEVVIEDGD